MFLAIYTSFFFFFPENLNAWDTDMPGGCLNAYCFVLTPISY